MTKYDMALIITKSEIYEGDYTIKELMRLPKNELEDIYNAMLEAEYEYYR